MTIELYPFQARGLDEGRAHFRAGRRAVLFVGPTGMGKTTLAGAAAAGASARGKKIVALAHRRELVRQMADRLAAMGLDVGALGRKPGAPVQVVSVQACLARGEIPDAQFVIIDEGHHYVSNDWIRVPRAYAAQGADIIGLSATPERDDGRGLGGADGIFDALVVVAQVADLVALNAREEDKGLTPIKVHEPEEGVRKLAQEPVDAYLEHTPQGHAVVFAPNVKSAHAFADGFRAKGIDVGVVHGELADADRDGAISRFAEGDLPVLVNVNVLTEGWDAPICDTCILARKIGSAAFYVQCVGRARRALRGKKLARLLDLSGNVALHGHPDEERVFSLEGMACMRKGSATGPRFCRVCKGLIPDGVERCPDPDCDQPQTRLFVPTAEDVALREIQKEAAMQRVATDTRIKALTTLYVNCIREGRGKERAHAIYSRMWKGFPPTDVRVPAWRLAVAAIAEERGDAWLPPEEEKHAVEG